jgi:hypothetical protein
MDYSQIKSTLSSLSFEQLSKLKALLSLESENSNELKDPDRPNAKSVPLVQPLSDNDDDDDNDDESESLTKKDGGIAEGIIEEVKGDAIAKEDDVDSIYNAEEMLRQLSNVVKQRSKKIKGLKKKVVKRKLKKKSKKSLVDSSYFRVEERESNIYIVIKDYDLCMELHNYPEFSTCEILYDSKPQFLMQEMYVKLLPIINSGSDSTMRRRKLKSEGLEELIRYLSNNNKDTMDKIVKMVGDGSISYEYLWYLFNKNSKYYIIDVASGSKIGSSVDSFSYKQSFFGDYFEIYGNVVESDGQTFKFSKKRHTINKFDGLKKIESLSLKPIDEGVLKELTERGKIFRELAIGAHYREYCGNIIKRHWYGNHYYKSDGRVMVDVSSFRRFQPEDNYEHETTVIDSLTDDHLFRTYPTIRGFSFASKKWGELVIENIKAVKFDDGAFDKLVLDADKKKLIKSLVVNKDFGFGDIISGKGRGCIFLLHGEPGTGKSLTAEAIAEFLHRPLYSVSVGQLGTDVDELEKNLREILDTGGIWNAIILIDEADIFMESRQENDIARNAMVAIFLRLLEYHDGILFLTTNRVKYFDKAFQSRISLALKYKDLDETVRAKIWTNLFDASKVDANKINIGELAKVEINGRQIRTSIKLAQSLAHSDSEELSEKHIMSVISQISQFQSDLKD